MARRAKSEPELLGTVLARTMMTTKNIGNVTDEEIDNSVERAREALEKVRAEHGDWELVSAMQVMMINDPPLMVKMLAVARTVREASATIAAIGCPCESCTAHRGQA